MRTLYKILLIIIAIAYIISPIDLIPDFLIPYIGWLDDIIVLWLVLYYLKYNRLPSFFYRKKKTNGNEHNNHGDFSKSSNSSSFNKDYTGKQNQNNKSTKKDRHSEESQGYRENNNHEKMHGHNYNNKKNSGYHKENQVKTPYEILGIDKNATKKEIHSAYRKLVKQYHPDRVAHLGKEFQDLANKKFIEIQDAYNNLMRL